MDYSLYVGTNSVRGSQGIYHIKLDGETGKITCTDIIPFYNSGYLVRNRAGDRLYVLTESMTFRGKASGGVVAYDISGDSPKEINSRFTCGQRPCHCALSQDERTLFAGNFFGGTIAVFPIDEDGGLCPASHIIAHERTSLFRAGIHCVMPHPFDRCLAAIELASNAINLYAPEKNYETEYSLELPDGIFPRHLEFSGDGKFLYLLSQEKSRIYVYAYEPENDEQLREIQQISTLPENFDGRNEAAAIRLSPNGNILVTSNRGVGDGERFDSIAVFIRNSVTGLLEQKQIIAIQGKTPRDVQFTWDGKWIIAAGQASDTLESYRMADDGTLSLADSGVSVPSPACIA